MHNLKMYLYLTLQVILKKNVKTTGVETRGNGAATKGTKARGPMA